MQQQSKYKGGRHPCVGIHIASTVLFSSRPAIPGQRPARHRGGARSRPCPPGARHEITLINQCANQTGQRNADSQAAAKNAVGKTGAGCRGHDHATSAAANHHCCAPHSSWRLFSTKPPMKRAVNTPPAATETV